MEVAVKDWLKNFGGKRSASAAALSADQKKEAAAIGGELVMLKARAEAAHLSTLSYLIEMAIWEARQA